MVAVIIMAIIILVAYSLMKDTQEGKLVIFLAGVAVLGGIGSLILPFLKYISYGAVLIILLLLGIIMYKKLFK